MSILENHWDNICEENLSCCLQHSRCPIIFPFFPVLVPLLLLLLSRFSRDRLCDPIDGSPPGSPIPGILQARTLEWVDISFSNAGKWKVKVKSLSRVRLLATPWTAAHQAPPSMGFSRQEYWSGVPLSSPLVPLELTYLLKLFNYLCINLPLSWIGIIILYLLFFLINFLLRLSY